MRVTVTIVLTVVPVNQLAWTGGKAFEYETP